MKTISIVGFGRFGRVLYKLLKDDFKIIIYNRSPIEKSFKFNSNTKVANIIEDVYRSEIIFYSVPIDTFEQVISSHKRFFNNKHLLIDVLSVKLFPSKIFSKYLKNTKVQAMLTHPMFGPDSSKHGFNNLPIIIDKFKTDKSNYYFWKKYFTKKKLKVIEMSAKEHDKLAANSQGLTHFIGRLLDEYDIQQTIIDSLGTKKLMEVKNLTCNDSWQLFSNIQNYNPYAKKMRIKLGRIFEKLNKIINLN